MSDYNREVVERALQVMWDEARLHGLPNPEAPRGGNKAIKGKSAAVDPAKRKGYSNPAHTGTHLAVIADVAQAWKRAGLTRDEKAAILGRYGLDLTIRSTGQAFGLSKSSVSDLQEQGLQKMVCFLNG